jgi:hypothetical protein
MQIGCDTIEEYVGRPNRKPNSVQNEQIETVNIPRSLHTSLYFSPAAEAVKLEQK